MLAIKGRLCYKNSMNSSRITKQITATMRGADAHDPVAAQYLYDPREEEINPDELADPIGDDAHSPIKGIVHRYPDRLLLKITDTCAVYCRFCFRKEMVGKGVGMLRADELQDALAYIQNAPQVREVILTGGDPLTLSNRRLFDVLHEIQTIPHIDVLRIHTRAPLTNPERIDDEFLQWAAALKKPLYMVVHVNHAFEINDTIKAVFKKLNRAGVILLSQSVLLKGVNDTASALEELFRTLIANRVKPYYLHHSDKAPGTSHFRVTIRQGQELMRTLRGRVSGIALPTYVLDIPSGFGKMPIGPTYFEELETHYTIEDYQGQIHDYHD